MPKISIIVPVYNVEMYLNRCVDSILGQTYTDFELILVNDGSPDNCGKICDEYAKQDKRVKVIHKKNGGVSSARNAGLDIASGDYLMFVDSDDCIHSQMVEILLSIKERTKCEIVECTYVSFKKEPPNMKTKYEIPEIKYYQKDSKEKIEDIAAYMHVSIWTKIYDSKIFDKLRFKEGIVFEDDYIRPYICYNISSFAKIELPLYLYRLSEVSIQRSPYSWNKVYSVHKMWEDHIVFYNEIHNKRLLKEEINKRCDSFICDNLYIKRHRKDLLDSWRILYKKLCLFALKELFKNNICIQKKIILLMMMFNTDKAYHRVKKYFDYIIYWEE